VATSAARTPLLIPGIAAPNLPGSSTKAGARCPAEYQAASEADRYLTEYKAGTLLSAFAVRLLLLLH